MVRVAGSLLSVIGLSLLLVAQQSNLPSASMTINGQVGPPSPVMGVQLPRGLPSILQLGGLPNARFVVGNNASFLPAGLVWGTNLVDLNLTGMTYTLNGFLNPAYRLDATGALSINLNPPGSLALNSQRCFQGAMEDPTSAVGFGVTQGTQLVVSPGLVSMNLSVGANGSAGINVNLAPYGVTIPFYGQSYSSFYVEADGLMSFANPNMDFTPTPTDFQTGVPRIAGYWTDLEPQFGGSVQFQLDQSVSPNVVRLLFTGLREYNGTGSPHTFIIEVDVAPIGNIRIRQSQFNPAAQYDILVGITPGGGLSPVQQQSDFSSWISQFVPGSVNRMYYEWYGLIGMLFYTAGFNNPWDLPAITTEFFRTQYTTTGFGYDATAYYSFF